jgi:hypothetical protein
MTLGTGTGPSAVVPNHSSAGRVECEQRPNSQRNKGDEKNESVVDAEIRGP